MPSPHCSIGPSDRTSSSQDDLDASCRISVRPRRFSSPVAVSCIGTPPGTITGELDRRPRDIPSGSPNTSRQSPHKKPRAPDEGPFPRRFGWLPLRRGWTGLFLERCRDTRRRWLSLFFRRRDDRSSFNQSGSGPNSLGRRFLNSGDGCYEAVAHADDGLDELRVVGIVAEQVAERTDGGIDAVF